MLTRRHFLKAAGVCLPLVLPLIVVAVVSPSARSADSPIDYKTQVRPLLAKYCFGCHGTVRQDAGLRLDKVGADFATADVRNLETWDEVSQRIKAGSMPPAKSPQPSPQEAATIVAWLKEGFEIAAEKSPEYGRIVMRRLTRYEYNYTLQDLLGVKKDFVKKIAIDFPSREGFHNNGSVQTMSSQLFKEQWAIAKSALGDAIVQGPRPELFRTSARDDGQGTSESVNEYRANLKEGVRITKPLKQSTLVLPQETFTLDIDSQYQRGRFRIKLGVEAIPGKDGSLPSMSVAIVSSNQADAGYYPVEERTIGEKLLPLGESEHVFTGYLEEFPQVIRPLAGTSTAIFVTNTVVDLNESSAPFRNRITMLQELERNEINLRKRFATFLKKNGKEQTEYIAAEAPRIRVRYVEYEIPHFEHWPPRTHTDILFDSPDKRDERKYARQIIERFASRAWRRPLKGAELDRLVETFVAIRPDQPSFEQAMIEVLAMTLVSPPFLYVVEPSAGRDAGRPLNDYELASRLSYFLWCSTPDAELLELARKGTLRKKEVLHAQVERMIADERVNRFVDHFSDQWFGLGRVLDVAVNPEHHRFDDAIKPLMVRETQLLFREIFHKNLSCTTLLNADFTFLNHELAKFYRRTGRRSSNAIPEFEFAGPPSSLFARVALRPEHRRPGGVLSHGSVLLANSDGVDSHPVKRGAWVLRSLFDSPPPEPPAEVPAIDVNANPDLKLMTLQQQLTLHNSKASCRGCHQSIDVWGQPFEEYDAIGLWRSGVSKQAFTEVESVDPKSGKKSVRKVGTEKNSKVESQAVLPDGKVVKGVQGLADYILADGRPRFEKAIVRKLASYALGRSLVRGDREWIDRLTGDFARNELKLRPLIHSVVQSDAFTKR